MELITPFLQGGFGMYPVLVTGVMLVVVATRYALDAEPIRLKFILALSAVLGSLLLFWTVVDVISTLTDLAADPAEIARKASFALGLTKLLNQWALGMFLLVLSSIAVAVGIYRSGRRQLKALEP
jgi:hypothetical protein